jgi:glutathione S-transferase
MSRVKLYVVPASHPCATVAKALELKGIPYERVDLVPTFHVLAQTLRFGGRTVPGIVFDDGRKVQGSRAILRELEARRPEPSLYAAGTEEAERWGDEVLQPLVRRVIWQALSADPRAQLTYMGDARLVPPVPKPVARVAGGTVARIERRLNRSTPDAVRADLRALPGHLDRIDAWIADGTLGGESAADLQVLASVRLLMTLDDLAPTFAGRPCADHARRLWPQWPGRVSAGALDVPA